MHKRKKILIVSRYFKPGFRAGGPIKSVYNIIESLKGDFEIKVLTSIYDKGSTIPYESVQNKSWHKYGPIDVFYSSKLNYKFILDFVLTEKPDLIYLNSFFELNFSLKFQLLSFFGDVNNSIILIAPRGEFDPGALSIKKIKKQFFLFFYRIFFYLNYSNFFFHLTSESELNNFKNIFHISKSKIFVASNIPSINHKFLPREQKNTVFSVVFLSRITNKKNLKYALEVIRYFPKRAIFDIYGPIEDEKYWNECKLLIKKMPDHIRVNYKGSIESTNVTFKISEYDVFFLPTKGENYGHVIVEALLSGTPVLISSLTPWNNLSEYGLGYSCCLHNKEMFVSKLINLYNDYQNQDFSSRLKKIKLAKKMIGYESAIIQTKSMFNKILGS